LHAVPLDAFIPGLRLGKSIYSSDGRVLLHQGTVLKDSYVRMLRERGIKMVFVLDEADRVAPEATPEDVIPDELRQVTVTHVRALMEDTRAQVAKGGTARLTLDASRARQRVNDIVEAILADPQAVVNLQELRSSDDYLFGHAVQVCVLAVMTGVSLAYTHEQLVDVGVGALLHDLGKLALPEHVWQRPPDRLLPVDGSILRDHPVRGFEMLWRQEGVALLAAHVAFQHHEQPDGRGYPRGLKGDAIHRYAKIVAAANAYDHLVAIGAQGRGWLPDRAARWLANHPERFDRQVVGALLLNVALYPLGSAVRLNSGETGIVIRVRKGLSPKPVVRVVLDRYGRRLAPPYDVDLLREENVRIERAIADRAELEARLTQR